MSADIKCYWDESCTQPLTYETQSYTISLGPRTGLNGDTGEVTTQNIYLRNEGDVTAQDVHVQEYGDSTNFFKISTPIVQYGEYYVLVGDISPNEVVKISLHSIIPQGTGSSSGVINYSIEYFTTPGIILDPEYPTYIPPEHPRLYEGTPIDNQTKAGKPYGDGPYSVPLYGQEGLIKVVDTLTLDVPIAGIAYTYIKASYSINARYDGTEATIEDVQSYYTSRYMALACFDGPALPLFLTSSKEV